MTLRAAIVEDMAETYRKTEPLYTVEAEQIETLPTAFARGTFGWRDAAWVVRWYFRRSLGDIPDGERQAREAHFEDNEFDTIAAAIETAVEAADAATGLEALTDLDGVNVPVGSAFLMFIDPAAFIVVGEREWAVLCDHDVLADPYPSEPSIAAYEQYLDACRSVAGDLDCELWTLYQALWRLSKVSTTDNRR